MRRLVLLTGLSLDVTLTPAADTPRRGKPNVLSIAVGRGAIDQWLYEWG